MDIWPSQTGTNLFSSASQPSIDRARGGKILIKLTIPSQQYKADGACGGVVTTDEMTVEVTIDVEKLPLVDTATYRIEEQQDSPSEMPYAEPLEVDHTFE